LDRLIVDCEYSAQHASNRPGSSGVTCYTKLPNLDAKVTRALRQRYHCQHIIDCVSSFPPTVTSGRGACPLQKLSYRKFSWKNTKFGA